MLVVAAVLLSLLDGGVPLVAADIAEESTAADAAVNVDAQTGADAAAGTDAKKETPEERAIRIARR